MVLMDILRKSHCHPVNPCRPLSCKMPEAMSGLQALPPNIPKKKIATRLASSDFVYHVDKV